MQRGRQAVRLQPRRQRPRKCFVMRANPPRARRISAARATGRKSANERVECVRQCVNEQIDMHIRSLAFMHV